MELWEVLGLGGAPGLLEVSELVKVEVAKVPETGDDPGAWRELKVSEGTTLAGGPDAAGGVETCVALGS